MEFVEKHVWVLYSDLIDCSVFSLFETFDYIGRSMAHSLSFKVLSLSHSEAAFLYISKCLVYRSYLDSVDTWKELLYNVSEKSHQYKMSLAYTAINTLRVGLSFLFIFIILIYFDTTCATNLIH